MENKDIDLNNLRHSAAHLLAAGVMEIWPQTKRAIGPAIENGFYFDFDFGDIKISEADFPRIEAKMREILSFWTQFTQHELSAQAAKNEYPNNPYKHELINEFSNNGELKVSFFKSGNYWDLCRGGHIANPAKELTHFKLLSVAGAYWRGNEKNKMLTRIYGTVFPTQKELANYLHLTEEAQKHDHRKIGKDLKLFVFSDLVGKGLPMLTPHGATIRRELERFVVDEEIKRGYLHVVTPPLAKVDLYRTSGHYPYYKETMYPPMKVDEEELILRPMTCPHHFMLYKAELRSYRELPVRFAELSPQFRYEKSGELTGLMRVRMFTLADAHIICAPEQANQEIHAVLDLIDYVNSVFGMTKGVDYRYRLSLGDRDDQVKYFKNDNAWAHAEDILRDVLVQRQAPFFEAEKEAAFYGPKIDVQVKNIGGKEETAFTVQYDFVMPRRFDLAYVGESGKMAQPIVIHRSSIGAFERTMAFLIEKYAGAFPLWLSPIQIAVIPIADRHLEPSKKAVAKLSQLGIRVSLDDRHESMQSKIRLATLQKIPFMAIIGDKEISQKETRVSVRTLAGKDLGSFKLEDLGDKLAKDIEAKR